MSILRFSSWSINIKIFMILLGMLLTLNLINVPLSVQTYSETNRQVFRQVVTESALRQKDAIDEDFGVAINIFRQLPDARIPYLSVSQWLTRSDPDTENFQVEATQAKSAAELAIESEILSVAPTLFRQAWLIDPNGLVISNPTNFIAPRFDVSPGNYVDVSESPAHLAGSLFMQSIETDRLIDFVVEEVDGRLSLQLIQPILRNGEFIGTLVVELNNVSIVLSNMQLYGASNNTYSFVASANNASSVITLPTTNADLINLDTQATRSSAQLEQAQSYQSGDRRVIGYYAPIFDEFRNDVVFVVELDELVALQDVINSLVSTIGPTLAVEIFLLIIAVLVINRFFTHPITVLTDTIRAINAGDFRSAIPIKGGDDEVGELAETVIELRQQLRVFTEDMTARVDARTRELQVTQEIGRVAISETNLDSLLYQVVTLIAERFDSIYHAQIFLVEGNYAVLKASTGEAGEQLLARGHRLGVGSLSVIGQVTQQNQTIVARDTAASEVHRRNEFLSDTRAELAIPLRLGSRVLGALDVQSKQRDGFDDSLVTILETMADQVAIAIENARLYAEVQQRLREFENTTLQQSARNWSDFMHTQRKNEIVMESGAKAIKDFNDLRAQAMQTGQIIVGDITERDTLPILLPIVLRGQALGVIEWEVPANEFNQDRMLLAEELASRLAVSLDNARLVQAGRQNAENERIINTISAKISGETDIDRILQTAIQEVGQVLRAPRVNIHLNRPTTNGHDHSDHTPSPDKS